MTSLALTQITTAMTAKEAAINAVTAQLEDRLINSHTVEMSDTTTIYTLSTANQTRNFRFLCSEDTLDSPSAARDLVFTNVPGVYVVENQSSVDVNLKISSTTFFTLPDTHSGIFYSDGTSLVLLANSRLSMAIGGYVKAAPTISEQFWNMLFVTAASMPLDLVGSYATMETAPSGSAIVIDVQKNGVSIGSINFADAATTATFDIDPAVTFAAGDNLEFVAPANWAGAAGFTWGLLLYRTVT